MFTKSLRAAALAATLTLGAAGTASAAFSVAPAATRYEAENLLASASFSGGGLGYVQGNCCGTFASDGAYAVLRLSPGDTFSADVSVPATGFYDLATGDVLAPDTGIYELSVDGNAVGGPTDTYNGGGENRPAVRRDHGLVFLTAGTHTVTLTEDGKDAASAGYTLAPDYFEFTQTSVVTGSGNTNPSNSKPNAFTISTLAQGGTLTFTGTKTFTGVVKCVNIVGNAATIVATDPTTGQADRTMVQDNGVSGDKLVNTLFDPSTLSANARAKALSCVAPDLAKLNAAAPLTGDAIQVNAVPAADL